MAFKSIINRIKKERPFTKPTKKPTVIDGEKVDDLISWVKNLVEEAKKVRDQDIVDFGGKRFCEYMKEMELWYIGDHWNQDTTPGTKKPDSSDLVVENRIHQTLDVIVSSRLANRPQIDLSPEAGTIVQSCEALQQALLAEFDEMEFDQHLRELVRNARKFGFAVAKLHHTFLQNEPYGTDIMYICDPLSILWVGGSELEGERKVKALIEVRRELKTDVEREFNVTNLIGDDDVTEFNLACYMNSSQMEQTSFEQVVTIRVWLDDTTMVEEDVTNEIAMLDREGQPIEIEGWGQVTETEQTTEKRRKYPNGRRIVVCGDTLLFDGDNPYKKEEGGHGLFPYVKLISEERPGHFCSISDIELIKHQQRELNDANTRISVNAALTAHNQREVDESGLKKGFKIEDITNKPGLNVPVTAGRAGTVVVPIKQTSISSESVVQRQNAIIAMENIPPGATDVARGESPASESGVKIKRLDVIQQRRGVSFIAAMESTARRLAKLEIGNLFQFKPEDEQFTARLELPDPEEPEPSHPTMPFKESLEVVSWGELKYQNLKYKIKILLMSSVASYRQAKFQEIREILMTLGQFMPPQLVAEIALKYSNSPEIYDFYKKWLQGHQREMEMMALQQGQGGQSGGGQMNQDQIQGLKQQRMQQQFGEGYNPNY